MYISELTDSPISNPISYVLFLLNGVAYIWNWQYYVFWEVKFYIGEWYFTQHPQLHTFTNKTVLFGLFVNCVHHSLALTLCFLKVGDERIVILVYALFTPKTNDLVYCSQQMVDEAVGLFVEVHDTPSTVFLSPINDVLMVCLIFCDKGRDQGGYTHNHDSSSWTLIQPRAIATFYVAYFISNLLS